MSLENFIPTIWSARLLAALDKALQYAQAGVVNRDYEGEITAKGDSVKINAIGDVTVKAYTKNTDIDNPETLQDGSQMLEISEQNYFNFEVDDVDRVQSASKDLVSEAMRRAAYSLRDKADQYIAASHSLVPAANLVGSDSSQVAAAADGKAYEHLIDLSVKLDEANVPTEGRWVIVPSWFHGLLLKDDRFVAAGTAKTDMVLANGLVGEAGGFRVLKSNNVPNTSSEKYKIIAGHPIAYSYADQIVSVEAFRMEKRFADGVKGLHVFGGKLVRPYAWAVGTCKNAST